MTIRLVIADDHRLFRQGLCALLSGVEDIEVVGEARNGEEAIVRARDLRPDIMLMDLEMPEIDGLMATQQICRELPHIKIVMLSAYEDDERIHTALRAGASGYVVKRVDRDELVKILRATHGGKAILSPYLADLALGEEPGSRPHDAGTFQHDLTEQELRVLELVAEGLSNQDITKALYMSKDAVKAYMKRIFDKLQVDNRTRAAVLALRYRLI